MIDTMPTTAQILKHQQQLPAEIRQSSVLLVFADSVNSALLGEFLTIRLNRMQHTQCEDGFYLVNRIQPERMGSKACPTCRQIMYRRSLNEFVCRNSRCSFSATGGIVGGPRSGILGVRTAQEFVTRTETTADGRVVEYVDRAVLVLDRRYEDEALAGILRTAHAIAEERGWKLK